MMAGNSLRRRRRQQSPVPPFGQARRRHIEFAGHQLQRIAPQQSVHRPQLPLRREALRRPTRDVRHDDGFDWGWIGLLGLLYNRTGDGASLDEVSEWCFNLKSSVPEKCEPVHIHSRLRLIILCAIGARLEP
jgi:hypothetical protein